VAVNIIPGVTLEKAQRLTAFWSGDARITVCLLAVASAGGRTDMLCAVRVEAVIYVPSDGPCPLAPVTVVRWSGASAAPAQLEIGSTRESGDVSYQATNASILLGAETTAGNAAGGVGTPVGKEQGKMACAVQLVAGDTGVQVAAVDEKASRPFLQPTPVAIAAVP
jgi:hypothetical protein